MGYKGRGLLINTMSRYLIIYRDGTEDEVLAISWFQAKLQRNKKKKLERVVKLPWAEGGTA